jgi:hypothetical protein
MITSLYRTKCVRLTCAVCVLASAVALFVAPAELRAQIHDHAALSDPINAAATLPHNIPDFCANATIRSVSSGAWSNPAIWSPARVPGSSDVVNVDAGTDVSYDISSTTAIPCLAVNGRLAFRNDRNTQLTVGTLMIMRTGELEVGSAAAPVGAGFTAEIVIANTPINTGSDPEQFGTGVLGFGIVSVHGAPKTPTWTRVAAEPRAGQTTVTLSQAVSGWRVGDRLILPDSRHLKWNEVTGWARNGSQTEERTISAISADAKVITLNQALQFDHPGARDNGGTGTLRLLPHVGNLTRNVIVRSQVPIGSGGPQGHILFTERADVDIRYAAFRDLGRTNAAATGSSNPIGRYPVHFHHLMGPVTTPSNGYQYTFVGNAIDGGSTTHNRRWSVAIHNTHYGLVSDNVAYNYAGALFTTEDGSESYNVLERNFAVRSRGTGGRLGDGNEGMGFWFRGPNNYVRGNVAAHFDSNETEAAYGYKYFMRLLGTVRIPTAKGQDTSQYVSRDGNNMPILEFKNNEVYSSAQGLTYWWLSSQDPSAPPNPQESVFEDLRIWHVYNAGVYHYPSANVRFERLLILGNDPASSACCKRGWHGEDYAAKDIRIVNSEIQGMGTGVIPSAAGTGLQTIENSLLRNQTDILVRTMYSANGPGWLPPRKIVVTNTRLLGGRSFSMDWNATSQNNTTQRDTILVYGYQDNSSDNFQVYYNEQGSQNVAGGRAPCMGTRPEISGIVCPISGAGTPTVTSLSPTTGDDDGGTSVTINGSNFAAGAKVSFGGSSSTQVVVNSASRITATSPAHAPGAVDVTVYNTDGRSATLANGYAFAGNGACTYSISPTSSTVGAAASSGSVAVSSGGGCAWTASSGAGWITITSGASGSGNGAVGYSVAANTGSSSRTGTLSIAGNTYTVTQQGQTQTCSYTVSPTSSSAPAGGTTATATVTTTAGCTWTAASNATWISVTAGASGTGNGTVTYNVTANGGSASRSGTLTVAGQTITVSQAGTGTACSYAVSPTSNSATFAGGAQIVNVTAAAGCSWTAMSNVPWMGITSAANGSGNGTVTYTIDPYTGTTPRTGTLTIAGQTVTVTQTGCPCTIFNSSDTPAAITGDAQPVELGVRFRSDASGSITGVRFYKGASNTGTHIGHLWSNTGTLLATATFTNETASGWQQVNFATPVTITANTTYVASYHTDTGNYALTNAQFASRGVDNGPLHALANGVDGPNGAYIYGPSAFPSQTFNSNNYWVDVVFTPSSCSYTVSPMSDSAVAAGETGSVSVTAQAGCSWTATSNASWITVTTGASGNGNGTVSYTIAANSGTSTRTGTLTVAGKTVTVTQAGACGYTVAPTSDSAPAAGKTGSVSVTSPTGCTWTAASNAAWITVISGSSSGSGDGFVNYTVATNSSTASRTGTLTVAGKTVTVTQAASASCSYTVSPTSVTALAAGKTGSVSITTQAGCSWTATSNATWITITSGASGNGNGTTGYSIAGNTSSTGRTGTMTVAGRTVTVTQQGKSRTIWPASATPAVIAGDSQPAELGVRFRSDVSGSITGVRFYKGASNTGTHVGHLWSNTGTLLATATFTNETASGWQQVNFATPVSITANTTYVASYHTNTGNYALTSAQFASAGVDNGPLHALKDGVDGPNAVYIYGPVAFPTQTFNSNNYWVDVVFAEGPSIQSDPCTYAVSPASNSVPGGSGPGSVTVAAEAGCEWTAVSDVDWIAVTSGESGSGNGTVTYAIAPNPDTTQRTGTLTVAGETVTVTQQGQGCTYTVSPTSDSIGTLGGPRTVTVTTLGGCNWTATSNVSWITIDAGENGNGSWSVDYWVDAYVGLAPRSGTLTIAGQTVTVTQSNLP